jgi:hypothetical protein
MRYVPLVALLACFPAVSIAQQQSEKPKTTTERLDKLEADVSVLGFRMGIVESAVAPIVASLDCADNSFAYITPKNSGLTFLVACSKVEPFLEGYRLTLSIGNPYSMHFDHFSAAVAYGETISDSLKADHSARVTSVSGLSPGIWNIVTVTISRVSAKDIRKLYLSDFEIKQAQGRQ